MNSIAICIVTYNHEKYIAQAIESVLEQKCNTKYTIFIGEDCSTDNTREICLEYKNKYPEKIELVLYEQNQGLVKNTLTLLKMIWDAGYSYVAMLDGDDYWIDENKLQKQFDFLDQNQDYGLVHTNNDILWTEIEHKEHVNPLKGDVFHCIENFNVANCTVLFRVSLLQYIDFEDFVNRGLMSCDYVMYAVFAKYCKFGFLDDFTAVWRRGHSSVSNTNQIEKDIAYIENDICMWNYLGFLYPERFGHTEKESEAWRNFRTFNIAFRYKKFSLANKMVKLNNMQDREGLLFQIKKIVARNRLLFYLWVQLKV
jgi:glycosyltransferase involved in cell wall biosynthesis